MRTLLIAMAALVGLGNVAAPAMADPGHGHGYGHDHGRGDEDFRHDNGRHLGWYRGRHRGWYHARRGDIECRTIYHHGYERRRCFRRY